MISTIPLAKALGSLSLTNQHFVICSIPTIISVGYPLPRSSGLELTAAVPRV